MLLYAVSIWVIMDIESRALTKDHAWAVVSRVTVEGEDLGADVKFGKPASETQHSPAPQRLTAGKLIPAPDVSPAAIDPAPEVVA